MRSKRPNAAEKRSSPHCDVVEVGAERAGQGGRRDRVVDVVQPRQAEGDAGVNRPASRAGTRRAPAPRATTSRAATSSGGRTWSSARAAVVAEVADVGGGVVVRRPAADAVLRVGGVLQGRAGDARIVKAEGDPARVRLTDRGELRIVRVVDETGLCRQLGHRFAPASGHQLELAVPVELVAEEVPEADRSRLQAAHEFRQRALVHLEQAEVGAPGREQRGGDAGDEVRAGRVVREPVQRTQDLGRHRGRRRLPVRRRDDCGSQRESRGQPVDRIPVELGEELARDRRTASGPDPARQRRHAPRSGDLE